MDIRKIGRRWLGVLLVGGVLPLPGVAQRTADAEGKEVSYRFRVTLCDKKHNRYSLRHPERYLSARALERRERYGIKVDEYDLPLSDRYLRQLVKAGFKIHNKSKWNNTVVVETTDSASICKVHELPFVTGTRWVWKGEVKDAHRSQVANERRGWVKHVVAEKMAEYYGRMCEQVKLQETDLLHRAGYRGEGMEIAVIDGGFQNADVLPALKTVKVLGTRNFAEPGASVYDVESHGMMVLSCMAANSAYSAVGTAPEAAYYLLQSEDGRTEQLVEEDNFAAALEYADSLGVDVVTASLGYSGYDYAEMCFAYKDLDGRTQLNSRSAGLAASRGMLFLNSAGNAGNDRWKKISCPADAMHILAVGALDAEGRNAEFSSLGYSADGRVKPDVMAMGERDVVYDVDGNWRYVNGTSFACPVMAGSVACLWQAHRELSPLALMQLIRHSGKGAAFPNEVYGYGLPRLWHVHLRLKNNKVSR